MKIIRIVNKPLDIDSPTFISFCNKINETFYLRYFHFLHVGRKSIFVVSPFFKHNFVAKK